MPNLGEVHVACCQRKIILPRQRGDPEIVIWNWPPHLKQFGFDLAVIFRRAFVWKEQDRIRQKIAHEGELLIGPMRSSSTKMKLAEYNPREEQRIGFGEAVEQLCFTAKVSDDDGRVYKDTTSRVH